MNRNDRKAILEGFLRIVEVLSNEEHQKNAWINNKVIAADFDEIICLFYDLGDPIFENINIYELSSNQTHTIRELKEQFDQFIDYHKDPREFIDSKEWKKIVKLSQKVLKAFPNSQNQ